MHTNQDQAIELAQDAISKFPVLYHQNWVAGMRSKLGLFNEEAQDETLIIELLNLMQKYHADFTNTFRALTTDTLQETVLFNTPEFTQWYEKWQVRLGRQQESKTESKQLMMKSNPAIIPRNYRVEEALKAATEQEDYSVMKRLLDVLVSPYDYSAEKEEYAKPPAPSACPYRTFCGT